MQRLWHRIIWWHPLFREPSWPGGGSLWVCSIKFSAIRSKVENAYFLRFVKSYSITFQIQPFVLWTKRILIFYRLSSQRSPFSAQLRLCHLFSTTVVIHFSTRFVWFRFTVLFDSDFETIVATLGFNATNQIVRYHNEIVTYRYVDSWLQCHQRCHWNWHWKFATR